MPEEYTQTRQTIAVIAIVSHSFLDEGTHILGQFLYKKNELKHITIVPAIAVCILQLPMINIKTGNIIYKYPDNIPNDDFLSIVSTLNAICLNYIIRECLKQLIV